MVSEGDSSASWQWATVMNVKSTKPTRLDEVLKNTFMNVDVCLYCWGELQRLFREKEGRRGEKTQAKLLKRGVQGSLSLYLIYGVSARGGRASKRESSQTNNVKEGAAIVKVGTVPKYLTFCGEGAAENPIPFRNGGGRMESLPIVE